MCRSLPKRLLLEIARGRDLVCVPHLPVSAPGSLLKHYLPEFLERFMGGDLGRNRPGGNGVAGACI